MIGDPRQHETKLCNPRVVECQLKKNPKMDFTEVDIKNK